ncbi:MAG: hypothetical protein Q7S22_02915 [Candidatus Micrarchaeota archaeon]|nr:hypothetical protein [Candidatus Micrarchaeota archaeon]
MGIRLQHAKERVTKTTNRILEKGDMLFENIFGKPNFNYALAGTGSTKPFEIKLIEPLKNQPIKFDTGNPPRLLTPERAIMDWELVDIIGPTDNPERIKGKHISQERAQKEVQKMLDNPDASHQYIAFEGAKLCGNKDAVKYTLHLMIGACGEDFVFLPGEDMSSIYRKEPRRSWSDIHDVLSSNVPSFLSGIFKIGAKLWRTIRKLPEDDPVNRPYFAHFYDPSRSENDRGLNILGGDLTFQSALERSQKLWMKASKYYRQGNKPMAFYTLGHILHLVADMHVPAHVHNDMHGPTIVLGKQDSLEGWVKRTSCMDIRRGRGRTNITIWDSGPLTPPVADSSWTPENVYSKIGEIMHMAAINTHKFRSVDSEGDLLDQKTTGNLTNEECFQQGDVLIRSAITATAQMISNFIDYHRRLGY